jgi:hypothetical protein
LRKRCMIETITLKDALHENLTRPSILPGFGF